jgi:hypothetical protein
MRDRAVDPAAADTPPTLDSPAGASTVLTVLFPVTADDH